MGAPGELTAKQMQLLRMIVRWGGDVPPDAEDTLGAHGAAFDAIIGGLYRRNLITNGAWGTFVLSDEAIALARGEAPHV